MTVPVDVLRPPRPTAEIDAIRATGSLAGQAEDAAIERALQFTMAGISCSDHPIAHKK
jgi:hypothetical protein